MEVTDPEKIYIATDSELIVQAAIEFGAQSLLTSDSCLTGTDRIAEVAELVEAGIYINLQGDEPFMPAANIKQIIETGLLYPDDVVNGWAWINDEADYRSGNVPKVVIREDGRLMYMSRSPIPGSKRHQFKFSRRQVCVYSFPRESLRKFVSRGCKTHHEETEDIEILRFLEMGEEVRMVELDGKFISVDTPEDLKKVREYAQCMS